jgi:Protein kinase domain
MGVVFLARQLKLDRGVALKVMAAELSGDEGYKARFEREARLAAALDHPHVIPLFETGEAGGLLYLAMRYVDGIDLAALLRRDGALDPPRAALIARQVGAALDAAHARGLIHRDVKPANVLLAEQDGELHSYLTDFGIAKDSAASTQLTHTGEWVGTLDYIAPEVLDTRRVDARADIYSLGCVLFQMLTGRVPYEGTSIQKMWGHANEPAPSVCEVNPRVPAALDAVVARAMAKDPDDRFASAGDLGRAAQAAAAGAPTKLAEQSVAVGAAATGAPDSIAPTRPARPAARPPAPAAEPATRRLEGGPGPWRRMAIPLAVIALGGGAAAAILLAGGDKDSAESGGATQARATDTAGSTETEEDKPDRTTGSPAEPSQDAAAPVRPARWVPYSPATFGYSTELPAGRGWSEPAESEPTPNRLYRTTVTGPDGFVLVIDYTPLEPATFGGDYDARRELDHPFFGSMTEYVFSGGNFAQCADSTCVDYIVNDEQGGFGYGVLGGGTDDPGLARDVARRVAESLTYEG